MPCVDAAKDTCSGERSNDQTNETEDGMMQTESNETDEDMADTQEEEKEEKDDSKAGLGHPEGSKGPDSSGSLADTRISTSGPDQRPSDRVSEGIEINRGESPGKSRGSEGVKESNPEPKGMKGSDGESKAEKRQGRGGERVPHESVPKTAEERVQLAKKMMALRQKERLEELESSDRRAMDLLQRLEKEKAQRLSDKRKRDKERKRDIEDRIRKLTSEEYERKQQLLEKAASDSNQSTGSSRGQGAGGLHRRRALSLFSGKEPNYTTPTVAYQIRTTRPTGNKTRQEEAPLVTCSRYRSVSPERYRSRSADYRPRRRKQLRSKSTDRPSRPTGPATPEARPRRSKTSTPPRQSKPTTAKTKKNDYGLSLSLSSTTTTTSSQSSLRRDTTPSRQTQRKSEALAEKSKQQEPKNNDPAEKTGDKRRDPTGKSLKLPLITLNAPPPKQVTEEVKPKQPKTPKEVKPLKEVKSPKEVRPPKEVKTKEVKPPKEAKPPKEVKPSKEVKPPKEVKVQKEVKPAKEVRPQKETKPQKEVPASREVKAPKEMKPTKEVKEAKGQTGVKDDTCSDDYKTKMLEIRRLAREKAKRQAEEDLAKLNKSREEEAEREREMEVKREQERQERIEADKKRAEEAQREGEDRRKREEEEASVKEEEARIKEEETKQKMEQEVQERELAEAKLKEEMKMKEKERLEKTKKEEEERMARKKKLDLIMKRVKTKDETKPDAGQLLKPDAAGSHGDVVLAESAGKDSDSQAASSASETSRSSSAASGEMAGDEEITPSPRDHISFAIGSKDITEKDTVDKDTVENVDKNNVDKNTTTVKNNADKDDSNKSNADKNNTDKDRADKKNADKNNAGEKNANTDNVEVDISLQPTSLVDIDKSDPFLSSTSDKCSTKDNEITSDKDSLSGIVPNSDKDESSNSVFEAISSDITDTASKPEEDLSVTPVAKEATDKSWNPFAKAVSSVSAAINNALSTARSSLATVTSSNADKKNISASTGDLATVTSGNTVKRMTSFSADDLSLATVTSGNADKRIISASTGDLSLGTVSSDNADKTIFPIYTDDLPLTTVTNDNKPAWPPADELSGQKSEPDQSQDKVKVEVKEFRNLLIDLGDSTEEKKVEMERHDDVTKALPQRNPVVMNQLSFDDDESDASSPADVVTPNYVMTPGNVPVYFESAAEPSSVKSSEANFSEQEILPIGSLPKVNTSEAIWTESSAFEANWSKVGTEESSLPVVTLPDPWMSDMAMSNVMSSAGVISTDADAKQTDSLLLNVASLSVMAMSTGDITTSQTEPTNFALSDATKPLVTSSVSFNGVIDDATEEDVRMSSAGELPASQSPRNEKMF